MPALKSDLRRAIIRTAARANQRHDLTRQPVPIAANATPIGWTDEFYPEPVSVARSEHVATAAPANLCVPFHTLSKQIQE